MNGMPVLKRFLGPALLCLFILASLGMVMLVHAAGEPMLAGILLAIAALAIWIYSSERCYSFRYLFPGIAAALIFVVFPMAYTVAIGFTNYSTKNLLEFPRATQYLLEETYRTDGSTYAFSLHPDGGRFRGRLEDAETGKVFFTESLDLSSATPRTVTAEPEERSAINAGDAVSLKEIIARQRALESLRIAMPSGTLIRMTGLSEFAPSTPLYRQNTDGSLVSNKDGSLLKPNFQTGFYETASGERIQPGFRVSIGWENYRRVFTEVRFRQPFLRIFLWTLVFSAGTVLFASALGMVLAVLLNWDALRFRGLYRLLLFLPYAVPAFISILVFKGLFNNNSGEINLILEALFSVKPAWFSDPFLAKTMLLIVNTWLGFPYMMVMCMGLIKTIPADLYEASAIAGAGPLTNFFHITMPLVLRPLTPLLIAAFAYNFNNFVVIALLTGGTPDFLDTAVPAGTTDILVSYTYRIAFQDSGQHFGLAAAISTVIFLLVAVLALIQIRCTRISQDQAR